MICKYCKVDMKIGKAIKPLIEGRYRSFAPINQILKLDDIEVVKCLKCPICGHSEDLS
jgi:hypothetical protein